MRPAVISGISPNFLELSQSRGQVAHVLLTRSPLIPHRSGFTVRLACVKHAASVRPEPGSNSPLMINTGTTHHNSRTAPDISEEQPRNTKARDQILASTNNLVKRPSISTKGITHETTQPPAPKDQPPSHPADEVNLASTFGTLLSSQRTDAHPQPHRLRSRLIGGNRSSLGLLVLPVKLTGELDDLYRRTRPRRNITGTAPLTADTVPEIFPAGPVELADHSDLGHQVNTRHRRE